MPIKFTHLLLMLLVILAVHSTAFAQDTAPLKKPTGIVRGRVRYGDTGNPVRRANVRLIAVDGGETPNAVVTSRKGEFLFTEVANGHYLAIVESPNLISPYLDSYPDELWEDWLLGQKEYGCAEVVVGPANSPSVTIVAQRGGVITGQITDVEGAPVAGAEVSIYFVNEDKVNPTEIELDSEYSRMGRPITNDRGIYRVSGLSSGTYVVRANDSDLEAAPGEANFSTQAIGSFVATYYPNAHVAADATPVKVVAGQETSGINLQLPDVHTHKVSGLMVYGRTFQPLYGVRYRVFRWGEEPGEFESLTDGQPAGYKGEWFANDLPDGRYVLVVDASSEAWISDKSDKRESVEILGTRVEFTIAGADISALNIPLDEASVLEGKVTFIGPKQDTSGLTLEAVPLSLIENGIGWEDDKWTSSIASIDDDGTFSFDPLPAGTYVLRLEGKDPFSFSIARVVQGRKTITGQPIVLAPGKPVTDLNLTLSTVSTAVRIKVASEANDKVPVNDALVFIVPAAVAERRLLDQPMMYRTDSAQKVSLRLRTGEFLIYVARRGPGRKLVIDEEFWVKNEGRLQHLKIAPNELVKDLLVTVEPEQMK